MPGPTGSSAPDLRGVPAFEPLRVSGPRHRLNRALRRRRRVMAAGLAMTAAALAAGGAGGSVGAPGDTGSRSDNASGAPDAAPPPGTSPRHATAAGPPPVEMASAPVRIADAATVRLLRRGDRVDVIATPTAELDGGEKGAGPRVVAAGARVAEIPEPGEGEGEAELGTPTETGALVVLSVPRATAADLAGASAVSPLAVTLC
nr:RcpC/CpaB family pilus assembly protein [Streptomyces liangshanensis]